MIQRPELHKGVLPILSSRTTIWLWTSSKNRHLALEQLYDFEPLARIDTDAILEMIIVIHNCLICDQTITKRKLHKLSKRNRKEDYKK